MLAVRKEVALIGIEMDTRWFVVYLAQLRQQQDSYWHLVPCRQAVAAWLQLDCVAMELCHRN